MGHQVWSLRSFDPGSKTWDVGERGDESFSGEVTSHLAVR
jgi:hypothetical protein